MSRSLGESRVHAAPKQIGIRFGPRTVGRIPALNRELHGLGEGGGPGKRFT